MEVGGRTGGETEPIFSNLEEIELGNTPKGYSNWRLLIDASIWVYSIMPSVSRSKQWFVRIDGQHEFLKEKIKTVMGWLDMKRVLGCLHVGEKKDNPHCHFVIEMLTELQKQSFDVRIKKLFNVTGCQYSSKQWDGADGACGYMFHESDDSILCNKGFSDEDIERFRELNRATQKVIAVNKEKSSHKFIDRAIATFNDGLPSHRDLLEFFLKLVREGEIYYPGTFRMKQMIEEVRIKMTPESEFRNMVDYYEEKLFR